MRVHFPISTGTVYKFVTFSCVFILVQLNKCVVMCGSDLERGHSGDGRLSSSILLNMRGVGDISGLQLIRSLFSSTYNLWLNSMFWKNLRSVLVL